MSAETIDFVEPSGIVVSDSYGEITNIVVPSGLATLDSYGKISLEQIPDYDHVWAEHECEYCGTLHRKEKCISCGAPRMGDK